VASGQWDTAKVAPSNIGDVYCLIAPLEPEESIEFEREDVGRWIN
jgi:hypothetical protein